MERKKVVCERACFANMSCQRLSIVFNFELSDIVESVIIKLSLAKSWVSCSNFGSRSFETKYCAGKPFFVV